MATVRSAASPSAAASASSFLAWSCSSAFNGNKKSAWALRSASAASSAGSE
jgi:hypothetical protein